uniref:At1g61320/AtMIF1 LRR domain-containing protein n=1 Tax=Leersia perrieri TaxID=77586 RepID=A0A0D9XSR0_9ORYZ
MLSSRNAAVDHSTFISIVRQLSSATLCKFVLHFPLLRSDADPIDRWVSLKLILHKVSIDGDLQRLLPECTVLEWLGFMFCSLHHRDLIIHRPMERLRYLHVLFCRLQKLELQAPNLTEFEFGSHQVPLVVGDCINLSMATVWVMKPSDGFDYAFTRLPVALAHVRDLLYINMAIRIERHRRQLISTSDMTGFYGIRGQLELAHRILRSTAALEHLIIDPKIKVDYGFHDQTYANTGGFMARLCIDKAQFPGTVITVL